MHLIYFYRDKQGRRPVIEYLEKLAIVPLVYRIISGDYERDAHETRSRIGRKVIIMTVQKQEILTMYNTLPEAEQGLSYELLRRLVLA